jgi:hypothetical protein
METIDAGIETQAKDRTTVNREIAVSTATKMITLNKIMETLTVIKVEATVITQEADPVTITAKGKETKTETETTTKIDIDKTIETKTTATPNADTTATCYKERHRENETHQIDTNNKSNDGSPFTGWGRMLEVQENWVEIFTFGSMLGCRMHIMVFITPSRMIHYVSFQHKALTRE